MTLEGDFEEAGPGPLFVTNCALWCPDEASRWGRRLKPVWKRLGHTKIAVPSGLTFARCRGAFTMSNRKVKQQVSLWPKMFFTVPDSEVLPPTILLEGLLSGLPAPNALRVAISSSRVAKYCLIINDELGPVAYARRIVFRAIDRAYHDFLRVAEDRQDSNIGVRLLANAVKVYRQLGIRHIDLTAGLSAGGSVWPKIGFCPLDVSEWKRIHRRILCNLRTLPARSVEAFYNEYGSHVTTTVNDLIARTDPRAIWSISGIDPRRRVRVEGWRYDLGAYLLHRTRWRGTLDLGDGPAFDRFKDYVRQKLGPGWP